MGSAKPGNHLKSGKMVKSVGFFFKSTTALQVNFFRFGQIVFNLARTFAAHHKESYVPRSFKVAIDQLFDNLESGKNNLSIVLEKSLEFWIQRSVRTLLWCGNNNALYPIECFHSRGQHPCKFVGTKESVCIRKELNSHRIGLGHQHGRRFIVLGHQYGRRDVMWKHSITSS